MSRRIALVTGFGFHARALERLMNARSLTWRMRVVDVSAAELPLALLRLPRADAVVCLGGPRPPAALDLAARALNKPVYVIWAGSDVTSVLAQPEATAALTTRDYVHGAVAPWLIRELRDAAIEAQHVKVAAVTTAATFIPFPAAFKILTYLPEPRRSFYGRERIFALARRFPDLPFDAIGVGGRDANAPANVRFLGHQTDVSAAIDDCVVLVRLPDHDGHAVMVNEALARGRHVIWTNALPGVQCVSGDDAAASVLGTLYRLHSAGQLRANTAGAAFVRAEYSGDAVVSSVEHFLQTPTVPRDRGRTRHVAVSGTPQIAGATCELVLSADSPWNPLLLETSSRLRTLAALTLVARSEVWYAAGATRPSPVLRTFAALLRKPRIMHWTAGDIPALREDPALARRLRSRRIVHVAEYETTAHALAELGIHATRMPLPIHFAPGTPSALPHAFTLLLDLPPSDVRDEHRDVYERLVRAFAGEAVRFLATGEGRLGAHLDGTVSYIGSNANRTALYPNCTALIRLFAADGTPCVLEALAAGRHVVWTQPFPHVLHAAGETALVHHVRELLDRHRRGALSVNLAGADFVRREFGDPSVLAQLESLWNRAAPASHRLRALAVRT